MLPKSFYFDNANTYCVNTSMCVVALQVKYLNLLMMYETPENIVQFQMCTLNHSTLMCEI